MTVYDGIEIKASDVRELVEWITELDGISEELRIRQQEIFQYKGKEDLLELQLRQAQLTGEILKLIRDYLRAVRITAVVNEDIKTKGDKEQ